MRWVKWILAALRVIFEIIAAVVGTAAAALGAALGG